MILIEAVAESNRILSERDCNYSSDSGSGACVYHTAGGCVVCQKTE